MSIEFTFAADPSDDGTEDTWLVGDWINAETLGVKIDHLLRDLDFIDDSENVGHRFYSECVRFLPHHQGRVFGEGASMRERAIPLAVGAGGENGLFLRINGLVHIIRHPGVRSGAEVFSNARKDEPEDNDERCAQVNAEQSMRGECDPDGETSGDAEFKQVDQG